MKTSQEKKDEGPIFIKIELTGDLYNLPQQNNLNYSKNAKIMNDQSYKAKKK